MQIARDGTRMCTRIQRSPARRLERFPLAAWLWKQTLFVGVTHSARERSGGSGILYAVRVGLIADLVLKDIQEHEDRLLGRWWNDERPAVQIEDGFTRFKFQPHYLRDRVFRPAPLGLTQADLILTRLIVLQGFSVPLQPHNPSLPLKQ